MATYTVLTNGLTMFDAYRFPGDPVRPIESSIISASPTEITIQNGDGSTLIVRGTGFEIGPFGFVSAGTIAGLSHFANGVLVDEFTGLNLDYPYLGNIPYDFATLYGYPGFYDIAEFAALGGDDKLDARARSETLALNGYDGNDRVYGGTGSDFLAGDDGDDLLAGGGGNDVFLGGDGKDDLRGGGGRDILLGDIGNQDRFFGAGTVADSPDDDSLSGNGSNDTLFGGFGNDQLNGGAGRDTAVYEAEIRDLRITRTATGFTIAHAGGTDNLTSIERLATDLGTYEFDARDNRWELVSATTGIQLITTGDLTPELLKTVQQSGTNAADALTSEAVDTLMFGLGGADSLTVNRGRVYGGAGNDRLFVGERAGQATQEVGSVLNGGNGNDLIVGGSSNDVVRGGNGIDSSIYYSTFNALNITRTATGFTVASGNGIDTLTGIERIVADDGTFIFNRATGSWRQLSDVSGVETLDPNSRLNGTSGSDNLGLDGNGKSVAYGLGGDDFISGGFATDLIFGGEGNDTISAGGGNDRVYGGIGDDVLDGGISNDLLTGGAGGDTFVMSSIRNFSGPVWGNDVILDFEVGVDKLALSVPFGAPSLSLQENGWLVSGGFAAGSVLLLGVTTPGLTLADLIA
jgi:Ca2+-binding RTX toxin-like protein